MTQSLDFLSESEVRQISSLVDALDRSSFDFFQIDVGDVKVTLGKGKLPTGAVPAAAVPAAALAAAPAPVAAPQAAPAPALAPAPVPAQPPELAVAAPQAGWKAITATTMGRFYGKPDPNSPPFVKLGDRVGTEDTVGLIEVMKLFNAIPAGISGTIAQVCVEDAEVVEFGQVLFYVQP